MTTPPRTLPTCIPPLWNLASPLPMLHSRPTLVCKPLIPELPILYLLPLPPYHRPTLLAILLHLLPSLHPDSLRVFQWNPGDLRARSTELLHFFSSHPVDLICIQESNLNSSSSFWIPGFSVLRSDRIRSRSGILSSNTTHASGGIIIFVRQGLSFAELSTSSLSSLDPYIDYVWINISLNNSSSLSFLNVYAPLFAPPQRMAEPTPFLPPSILSSSKNLFILGDFNCHHPLWDSRGTSDPREKEVFDWVTSSDLLPLNDPDTPTLLDRFSGSRSSPDISFAPSSLALSCSWEVLQDLGSDHLPILLSNPLSPVYRPNERPPSFNFQKAHWDGFVSYFDSHCPSAEEYSSLSLSSAAALFTSLALNAAKSFIPFGRIKRPPKAWWSPEVEQAVSERCKAFAAAHRSDKDRQAYISASRRASSVIAKAKTEAWQTTCSSLSPKSNPTSVHSLLRSIAGSPSSSSSSPNFPNCSSPRESASIYAAYLRFHFSVSQPKALRSRARGYLTELRRATSSEESHSSFCSLFSLAEFLAAASNLPSSTATGPDKVAYLVLNHLPRSGMDFLLYIFNLFRSLHSFSSIWKTSSIIPIHKMGKPLDSPASFWPISLTSCASKLFGRIILSRLFFFLESNSILSPRQAGFRPGRSTLDQILYLSQSFSDGFNKPRPGSRTILSTIDFSKAFDPVWHCALFHKLISAGLHPCFARWTQSFLSNRRACVVFQNQKSRSFRVRRGVPQGSVLGPVLFSLFINDLPASLPSSVSCSLYADDLAIWSSSLSVPTAVEATQRALFRLERWSEYWCIPLNPSKCEASFFSVDSHQANLQPNLLLLGSRLRFNPTSTFPVVAFDRTLSCSRYVSSLKAKFFPHLKALRCIAASSWGSSKESLSLLYKSFLRSLLTYASPGWFPFLSATNLTKLERLH